MTDARLDSAYGAVEDGGVRGEEARASPQRPHFRALVQALALLCVVSAGVSMNARTAVAPVLDKIVDDDDDRAAVHVAALTTRTLFLPTTFAPTLAPFSRVAAPLKDEEARIHALEDKIDALRSREAAQEARRDGQRRDTAGPV